MENPTRGIALVTGASAGIGAAFARELWARGYDLVLTARRRDRLEALERELAAGSGRRIEVLPADLADPTAPRRLLDELSDRGIAIEILVNNAGYGIAKRYVDSSWQEQRDFLQVMVTAVAELSHGLLPGMLERGSGRIINVASLVGLIHGLGRHTLYPAAKGFMIKFTECLALEVAGTGVTVTAVCPGLTYSEFHDADGTREQMREVPRFLWMDAETVARQGVEAAFQGKTVYVNGIPNKLVASFLGRLPRPLAAGLVRLQSRLEAHADSA